MNLLLNSLGFFVFLFTLIVLFIFVIKLMIFFFKQKNFPKKTLTALLAGLVLFFGIFIYIQYFFTFGTLDKKKYATGARICLISYRGIYSARLL